MKRATECLFCSWHTFQLLQFMVQKKLSTGFPFVHLIASLMSFPLKSCGSGSVVGIAIGYGLDGPGIESWWGRDFLHLSWLALEPTQSPVQWVPVLSFPGCKEQLGRDADPSPPCRPWSWKGRAVPLLPLWACMACTEPQCLYKGALYLFTFKFILIGRLSDGRMSV